MPWSRVHIPSPTPVDNSVEMVEKPCHDVPSIVSGQGGPIPFAIFAKEPVVGRVKTRLTPPLTPLEATELYRSWLEVTVATMAPFSPRLCYSGAEDYFEQAFPRLHRFPQGEGDLGARLQHAFARLLAPGGPAAIIGSDSPDLPPALVRAALSALHDHDVVTIPARDGGYLFIGLRAPQPQLFTAMPWSTPQLLAATRARATASGLRYRELGLWDDVDDLAALCRLLQRNPTATWAARGRSILERVGVDSVEQTPFGGEGGETGKEGFTGRIVDKVHPAADVDHVARSQAAGLVK